MVAPFILQANPSTVHGSYQRNSDVLTCAIRSSCQHPHTHLDLWHALAHAFDVTHRDASYKYQRILMLPFYEHISTVPPSLAWLEVMAGLQTQQAHLAYSLRNSRRIRIIRWHIKGILIIVVIYIIQNSTNVHSTLDAIEHLG